MNSLFSVGMWGAALIGFGVLFLITAVMFMHKELTRLARAGFSLCGIFGLACVLVGLWLMAHAPLMGPSWHGFQAFVAYLFSLMVGVAAAVLLLAILIDGRNHHKPLIIHGKF